MRFTQHGGLAQKENFLSLWKILRDRHKKLCNGISPFPVLAYQLWLPWNALYFKLFNILWTGVNFVGFRKNSVSSEKKVFGFSWHLPTAFIALKRKFPFSQSNKFRTYVHQYLKFEVAGVMSITADMRMLWGNTVKSLAAPEDNMKRIHRWH